MTAVEFIAQELSKQIDNNLFMEVTFNKLLAQAKEMEKGQIVDAWDSCGESFITEEFDNAEQYYNETFKSE